MPFTKEQYTEGRKNLVELLKGVDAHLSDKEFLAINQLTVADVVIASLLRYIFTLVLDEAARAELPNLTKWFVKTMEHPINLAHYGKTWLCQKEVVPDFEFLKSLQQVPKKE